MTDSDLTALIAFDGVSRGSAAERERKVRAQTSEASSDLHARHAYRKYGLMNCIRHGGALRVI